MASFQVKDGHFWLDDQRLLLQAGEFHYYRTPASEWAHRLGLLQSAGFNAVASYIPWLWHQPAPDVSDLDGHTHPMRNLAGFLDLAAEMGLYIIARPGPYIMAETINEGIPPWVFEQHPAASFIAQDGRVHNIASYLQPDFLKRVEDWYQAVFAVLTPRQITRGGRIVLIQLDNEMGMIHWVRNILDTNPDTLARFAEHLRWTHGQHLHERYPAADLTAFLRAGITDPNASEAARVVADYRRFYRAYLREYAEHLWERAQAHGMDVPPVINIHGFTNTAGGRTFPIGLSQLIDAMAIDGMVSATDVYPREIGEGNLHELLLVNEMTKAVHNPQQPLFSIEFRAGGNQDFSGSQASFYDLHTRLSISVGMRGINHYLFFDGENDPILSPIKRHDWGHPVRKDGTLRRHYQRYPRLSRVLAAYGDALIGARPQTVTTIGFTLDSFMTEVNTPASQPAAEILTHQREAILFDLLARGLALTQRPFDAVELGRAALNPAQIPLLWVMIDKQCDAAVQRKLADYVQQGGKLILVGRMCEETFDRAPCTILRDSIGIEAVHSDPPFTPAHIHAFETCDIPVMFRETYSGDYDEVFATALDGQTVGFVKQVGAGQVMMLGAAFAANTLEDLEVVRRMADRMGCPPLFALSDWADVRLSQGDHGRFLFVNNYQDDPIETTVALGDTPLFGGHALTLPARRGLILPLDWQVTPGIVIHWLTAEVTEMSEDAARVTIKTEPAECFAEISLSGYRAEAALIVQRIGDNRVRLHVASGVIDLTKE